MRCVPAPRSPAGAPAGGGLPPRQELDAVRYIARRFPRARVREVPLVRAEELDRSADPTGKTRIWLALETLQVTGSFHVRGALLAVEAALHIPSRHVVAPSVGNHGIAVAYAACVLGLTATIVLPRTASRTKREKVQRYGAELVVATTDLYEDAEARARAIAAEEGALFVAPGEALEAALGNGASLGFEIVRALGGLPDRVLVPLGVGALATGLGWAFASEAGTPAERFVWGVQCEGCCAMAASLELEMCAAPSADACAAPSGAVSAARSACGASSLAEGLAVAGSREAMERARAVLAGVLVAREAEIALAMAHAHEDMGLVIEGTAALSLVPVLQGLPEGLRGDDVVVVLTGRNVDPERLEAVVRGVSPGAG